MVLNLMPNALSAGGSVDELAREAAAAAESKAQVALDGLVTFDARLAELGPVAASPATSPVPTGFILDAQNGDHLMPSSGGVSYEIRRITLRARGGLTEATVAPKLSTDGASPRQVAIEDESGALSAVVTAGSPPLALTPTKNNLIGSWLDLYGKRLPMFTVSGVSGTGELEVILELAPLSRSEPTFSTTPTYAAAFADGANNGDGPLWVDGPTTVGEIVADPLYGNRELFRSHTEETGNDAKSTINIQKSDDFTELWAYTALRVAQINSSAMTPVIVGAAGGTEVWSITIDGPNERLVAQVDGTTIDLGDLVDLWPDYDPSETPNTTDLLPILVHYSNTGDFEVWIGRDIGGTPTATHTHAETAAFNNMKFGVYMPDAADTNEYYYTEPKIWLTAPGVA